tara:strand:+ start:32986 stop:35037 length:2052 start_codon:yes stop_codon:yes gene_type:complete
MFLNKSVMLSLLFTIVLSGCSGSDGFGLGNGNEATDTTDTTDTTTDTGGEEVEINPKLGSGSGESFSSGVLTTNIPASTNLSYGGSAVITVNLVDANAGNALVSTPSSISFTSGCVAEGLASIGDTAITSAGKATVSYTATSCSGSDTVVATLGSDPSQTASVTFGISSLDLGTGSDDSFYSGALTTSIGDSDLSYGGDTVVSVNIVDSLDNSLFTTSSVTVNFTSGCVQSGKSTIDATVNTTTGTAVATYSAISCEGADTIIASLSDGTSASKLINVAGQVLGALEFVSASPSTIALRGSGSAANPEVSTLSFSLKDKTGAPMAGETINYSLSTLVGGISLSSDSSVTNVSGITSVQLSAGGVNVSVVLIASVEITNSDGSTSTTSTTSDPIAILGGIPDQDSFSIAASLFNPRGWDIQGTVSTITVRGADRYNNPARNGTQISFLTNGGAIVGSCAFANGVCSANWSSQKPKPVGGRVRILARSTGEESFTDSNSNGVYDLGEEVLTNLPEAFLDIDESNTRNLDTEFYSDFNNNGVYDVKTGTKFQGTNCSAAALADGHCANLVEVRQQIDICMSTDYTEMTSSVGSSVDVSAGPVLITLGFFDANGNTPANGTNIAISVEDGELEVGGTFNVPNECAYGAYHTVVVGPDDDIGTASGVLKIDITQADKVVRPYRITLIH